MIDAMRCPHIVISILLSFHDSPLKAKRFILCGAADETFLPTLVQFTLLFFFDLRKENKHTRAQTFK